VQDAEVAIIDDGFELGTVTSDPPGTDPVPASWIVTAQSPGPGSKQPAGTAIDLTAKDPATIVSCP
jgi:hypothetical protein